MLKHQFLSILTSYLVEVLGTACGNQTEDKVEVGGILAGYYDDKEDVSVYNVQCQPCSHTVPEGHRCER